MQISSSAFANNRLIPGKYTCRGANVSPPLHIRNIPKDAKSLALIMHDPDAPNGDWLHWAVWNIDKDQNLIGENSVPEEAVEGATDFGETGYGGPCPPSGTHRYLFELYALDSKLDLEEGARREELDSAMEGHILETSKLTGLFSAR